MTRQDYKKFAELIVQFITYLENTNPRFSVVKFIDVIKKGVEKK